MTFPDLQKYKLYNKLYKWRKFCKTMIYIKGLIKILASKITYQASTVKVSDRGCHK